MLRYLDVSPPGGFSPLDVSISGHFATSLDVSPPDDKEVFTVSQITNFQTGGQTSREVAKRPGIKTSKGAKWRTVQVSESSKVVAKRPGAKLAK